MFFYVCLILTLLIDWVQQLPMGFNYKRVHRKKVFFLQTFCFKDSVATKKGPS